MSLILREAGVHPDSTHHVVASLIQASLRGVDSHGINLFPHYCRELEAGRINKKPCFQIQQTAVSTVVMDADHAFGYHAGAVAMDKAVESAKKTGVAAVSVKNSSHFGSAAYFGLRAAEKDCLGFVFTNADALVKAHGSREAFWGTNPICFTAPMAGEPPFCLDMSTSAVSWNKIQNFRQNGLLIPAGWAFDENGNNVTDPNRARMLNPIGEYKGFGLAAMVDILCALLADGPLSKDILPMYTLPLSSKRCISHFFMAMDISKFIDPDKFKQRLREMAQRIRTLTPLDPASEVKVAGDPEKRTCGVRRTKGIPLNEVQLNEFLSLSPRFKDALQ